MLKSQKWDDSGSDNADIKQLGGGGELVSWPLHNARRPWSHWPGDVVADCKVLIESLGPGELEIHRSESEPERKCPFSWTWTLQLQIVPA